MPKSSYTIDWAPNGTAICTASELQVTARICTDGAGGAIIAWQDQRNSQDYDIYAQRVDANGAIKWYSEGIAICTEINRQSLSWPSGLVSDETGGAIIAWQDFRDNNADIYAQRINSTGGIKWGGNGTAICTANNAGCPQICTDGEGGAIIAWYDERNTQDFDIYAQRVDSTGNLKWADGGAPLCTISGDQLNLIICSDGMGGAIIVWDDKRTGYDIYAQAVDSYGAIKWTAQGEPICTAIDEQREAMICADGAGGAIITWIDRRTGGFFDIYAQRIDINGAVKWIPQGVPICTEHQMEMPSLCSDGAGGAIITWEDYRGGLSDIYAQRVDTNGIVKWTANGTAICTEDRLQIFPFLCSDGRGGAIITWIDERAHPTYPYYSDIYAQLIDSNGVIRAKYDGIIICAANNSQDEPTICSDGNGGAIIAWEDRRSSDQTDIYAQHIKYPIPISETNGDGDDGKNKEAEEISLIPLLGIIGGSIAVAGIAIIIAWKKHLFTKKPRDINE